MLLLPLIFNHPLYLVGILLASLLAAVVSDALGEWFSYFTVGYGMHALVLFLKPPALQSGETVLLYLPSLAANRKTFFYPGSALLRCGHGYTALGVNPPLSLFTIPWCIPIKSPAFYLVLLEIALVVSMSTRMIRCWPGI